MEKIASFTIDHLNLKSGIYVSRVDERDGVKVTTFDLRMTMPNREPVIDIPALHTIEHLGATFLRNSDNKDDIVYFGAGSRSIEINHKGVSKGKAVKALADYYGFKREEIVCIGDNENDYLMLKEFNSVVIKEHNDILNEYRNRSAVIGKDILVIKNNETKNAKALLIDDNFRLNVRYNDKTEEFLDSGEISIKI